MHVYCLLVFFFCFLLSKLYKNEDLWESQIITLRHTFRILIHEIFDVNVTYPIEYFYYSVNVLKQFISLS